MDSFGGAAEGSGDGARGRVCGADHLHPLANGRLTRRRALRAGLSLLGAGALTGWAAGPAAAGALITGGQAGDHGGDHGGGTDGSSGTVTRTAAVPRTVVTSYNGWPIGTPGATIGVASYLIPGTSISVQLKSGDVATVLLYLAGRFNAEVETLHGDQVFGYDYRKNVNNPSVWSNHASGTAIDLNADLHPNTVRGTFTAVQVAAIRRILGYCGDVLYWGGDYTGTVDAMHFEINVPPGDVRLPELAAKIRAGIGAAPVVSLRAGINHRFVTAEHAGDLPLIANRTAVGPWEQFDLLDRGSGTVALRARINGRFVCADNAGRAPLVANRTLIGPWETFALLHNSNGTVSLRALANGSYVTAEGAGSLPLIANRSVIGPWEQFTLLDV